MKGGGGMRGDERGETSIINFITNDTKHMRNFFLEFFSFKIKGSRQGSWIGSLTESPAIWAGGGSSSYLRDLIRDLIVLFCLSCC
jgi:hypothetical protein